MDHLLLIMLTLCGGILLLYTLKKCKFKYFLLSALSGMAALIATDLIGNFISMHLPLNPFSIAVSALGGLPGVILLNILHVFFL